MARYLSKSVDVARSYLHQLMWLDLKLEPVDVASNLSVPVDVVRLRAFSQLMWQGTNLYQLMWSV